MADEIKMFSAREYHNGSWAVVYTNSCHTEAPLSAFFAPMTVTWSGLTEEDARAYVEHNNAPEQKWFWLGAPILQLARSNGIKCKSLSHR